MLGSRFPLPPAGGSRRTGRSHSQGPAVSQLRRSPHCWSLPLAELGRRRRNGSALRAPLDDSHVGRHGKQDVTATLASASHTDSGESRQRSNLLRRRNPQPTEDRALASALQFPADCPHSTHCHCSPIEPYLEGVTVKRVVRDTRDVPAYSQVFQRPVG